MTDIILKFLGKNLLSNKNLKALSWCVVSLVSTFLLGWLITGRLVVGIIFSMLELLTKLVLHYGHERLWQRNLWRILPKLHQERQVQIKPYLFRQTGGVTRSKRESVNGHTAFTLWFTGLSASGKTTLAIAIEEWIFSQKGHVYILDGDNTRLGLNKDLSFSEEDRSENIRRVAELCKLFNDAGIIIIASFISPFIKDRKAAKDIIGSASFTEVYLEASLSACKNRDPKGLYQKALTGKIKNFTGISSPYEPPLEPDLHLNTEKLSVEECKSILQQWIALRMQNVSS